MRAFFYRISPGIRSIPKIPWDFLSNLCFVLLLYFLGALLSGFTYTCSYVVLLQGLKVFFCILMASDQVKISVLKWHPSLQVAVEVVFDREGTY